MQVRGELSELDIEVAGNMGINNAQPR